MATYREQSDRITLSQTDIRLMVALLDGPASGYRMARIAEEDSSTQLGKGTLQAALKGMATVGLIERAHNKWQITPLGKDLLESELAIWRQLLRAADKRLAV